MQCFIRCLFLGCFTIFHINISGQETDKDIRYIKKGWKQFSDTRAITGLTSDYDVNYYKLDLNADPAVRYIRGSVTTYFKPTVSNFNNIHFNLNNNMVVDSVIYHGNLVTNFSFLNSTTLQITFPTSLPQNANDSIKIFYQGIPVNDGFGSFGLGTNLGSKSYLRFAKGYWNYRQLLEFLHILHSTSRSGHCNAS